MKVSYSRLILYGFVTYAAIFMLWSLLAAYRLVGDPFWQYVSYTLTFIVILIASRMASVSTFRVAVVYGIGWTLMHIVLDAVYVTPSAGVAPFMFAIAWVGYALVFVTPFLQVLYERVRSRVKGVAAPVQQ